MEARKKIITFDDFAKEKMKTKEEIIEYVYDMNLQNLTEKTSFDRAYKQGIEDTIEDLIELNLLTIDCCETLPCSYAEGYNDAIAKIKEEAKYIKK